LRDDGGCPENVIFTTLNPNQIVLASLLLYILMCCFHFGKPYLVSRLFQIVTVEFYYVGK